MKAIIKINGVQLYKKPTSIKSAVTKAFRLDRAFNLEGFEHTNIRVEVVE